MLPPLQWSSEYADTDLALVYYNYRLYKSPVDMRYGMFRLQSLIYSAHGNTKEGAYHFFVNRPMSLLKVVWFDGTGLRMLIKRLEKEYFS